MILKTSMSTRNYYPLVNDNVTMVDNSYLGGQHELGFGTNSEDVFLRGCEGLEDVQIKLYSKFAWVYLPLGLCVPCRVLVVQTRVYFH